MCTNMNAFKDFNSTYFQHSPNRSFLLNKLSRFLNWTPDQFLINNLDAVIFFRNLNDILLSDDLNSDYLWTVFKVVNIAIENRSTHQYLIDTVRIITGVSNFALKVDQHETEDRYSQLWIFMEKITKGIDIRLEESYLTSLIDYLVTRIKTAQLPDDIKTLQVSILTNLCFKNKVAIACLLRFTKSKDLLESIAEMPILRCKLAIAIAHFQCNLLENEPEITLKYVFETKCFYTLMEEKHNLFLTHLLELLETKDEYSRKILQKFDFKEPIEEILTSLNNSIASVDVSGTEKEDSKHMDIFLGIINAILSVSNVSLESNLHRLFTLAFAHIGTVDTSSAAIKTIRLIVSSSVDVESEKLYIWITRLVENMDTHHLNSKVASEIYQLLSALYGKYPNIFNQLTQDIIKKSLDLGNFSLKLTDDNLAMQLYRLQWFLIYASQQEAMLSQVSDAMKNKDVQHIFASGLSNSNEEICALTMTLIRSSYFPLESVSKLLSMEFSSNLKSSKRKIYSCNCESKPTHFSAPLEKRVKTAVDQIMEKVKDAKSSVERVELIDMIEYQSMFASSKESLLQSQLKASSDMITMQSNEIGCLKAIIRLHHDKIGDLEKIEANHKETLEKMKAGYNSLKLKYDHISVELGKVKATRTQLQQERDELQVQYEKDRKTHSSELAERKKEFEKKISDLTTQHEKDLIAITTKSTEKHEREKKERESQHKKELENYSKKLLHQKKENEQKVSELTSQRMKDVENYSIEVEHLKTELDKMTKQNIKYEKEISEKSSLLLNKTSLLEKYESEIEEYKKKADLVMSMFTSKS